MAQVVSMEKYLDDINNDLESRKHDLPTNPFDKQRQTLGLFPSLSEHYEDFYTSEFYYPSNTRDKLDKENISSLVMDLSSSKDLSKQLDSSRVK